jgi:hypothetical protein
MHIEVLVEDSSGERLLQCLFPKVVGAYGEPHTWRFHSYRGIGRIPKKLSPQSDPAKRILLDRLPRLLRAYGKTPGIDAIVVVLDADRRNCNGFLRELNALAKACKPSPVTLFRLAVEEIEAWYFGDRSALLEAYPRAKQDVLSRYKQDSICGTWELLADAIYPGGLNAIKSAGWPLPGEVKHEWAERIGPRMDLGANLSPSFCEFRDGLRALTE